MNLRGQNIGNVRNKNMSVVLNSIKKAGAISRTELAEETGLSHPAIGNLVSELIELQLVKEVGSLSSSVGRSRVMLSLDQDSVRVVGMEIARNGVTAVLMNLSGEQEAYCVRRFALGAPSDQVMYALFSALTEILDKVGPNQRLIGIGIGTPGPVDVKAGRVFEPPNFPGLQNIALKELIEERLGLLCLVNDDARTSAMAEAWFGVAQDVSSFVFISFGEGIGSGVVVNGRLYNGFHDIAGQIGHFTVQHGGLKCECGNIGCLETVASIPAIARRARQELAGRVVDGSDAEVVTSVIRMSNEGDPKARELFEETLDYIATAAVSAINAYDPQMVVLGGRLTNYCPDLIDRVRRRVVARCYYHIAGLVEILGSKLGEMRSALGGGTLVLEQLLSDPVNTLMGGWSKGGRKSG